MEPLSLIVMALLTGASAAGKAAVGEAVKDAYAKLKTLVARRVAGRDAAQTALAKVESQAVEKGPEQVDAAWRTMLDGELEQTGAGQDQELVAAAQQLMALLDHAGAQTGKYTVDASHAQGLQVGDRNTQTNTFGSS